MPTQECETGAQAAEAVWLAGEVGDGGEETSCRKALQVPQRETCRSWGFTGSAGGRPPVPLGFWRGLGRWAAHLQANIQDQMRQEDAELSWEPTGLRIPTAPGEEARLQTGAEMGLHGSAGAPVGRAGEERHCPRLGPVQTGSWALCTRCPLRHVSAMEAILALVAWPLMAPTPQAASTATTLCACPPRRPRHSMLLPDPKFSYPLSKIILIIGKMEIRTPPSRLEKINCASVGKKCAQKPIASVRQANFLHPFLT